MKHNIFFAACVVVVSLMATGCSNNSGSDKKQTMVKAEKEDSIAAERLKMGADAIILINLFVVLSKNT